MDISILQDSNQQITVCGPILFGPNTARHLLICTSSHPYPTPKMVFVLRRRREGEGKKKKHATEVLCPSIFTIWPFKEKVYQSLLQNTKYWGEKEHQAIKHWNLSINGSITWLVPKENLKQSVSSYKRFSVVNITNIQYDAVLFNFGYEKNSLPGPREVRHSPRTSSDHNKVIRNLAAEAFNCQRWISQPSVPRLQQAWRLWVRQGDCGWNKGAEPPGDP